MSALLYGAAELLIGYSTMLLPWVLKHLTTAMLFRMSA